MRKIFKRLLVVVLGLAGVVAVADEPISGVTARATSEQVKGLFAAQNVCTDRGLSDSGKGDGSRKLTINGYADNGNCWHSGYIARGADESPIIEFDLGKVETVGRFHVWNHNGSPSRGFKHVSVIVSDDSKKWRAIAQRFEFAKAPKSDDYLGEDYSFEPPITARYIRFHCDTTHRTGGQPDLAGLGKVRFYRSHHAPRDEPNGQNVSKSKTTSSEKKTSTARSARHAERDGYVHANNSLTTFAPSTPVSRESSPWNFTLNRA
jgi:hypothetical protein